MNGIYDIRNVLSNDRILSFPLPNTTNNIDDGHLLFDLGDCLCDLEKNLTNNRISKRKKTKKEFIVTNFVTSMRGEVMLGIVR